MTKEFVPYELAIKLKELGFDEPCFFAFDKCSMRCSDLRTNEQKFEGVNYNSSSYTSQPTFQQAFRWFREEYNLLNLIGYYPNAKKWYSSYQDLKWSGKESLDYMKTEDRSIKFETYEEAELTCLGKLIEIVESKQEEQ